MAEYKYPVPGPDVDSAGFWEGAKEHELRIQQCSSCGRFRHPPRKVCAHCHSEDSLWVAVGGRGKVVSSIQVFQPVLSAWREDIPYNVVEVELEDAPGITITGNVPEAGGEFVHVGTRVEVFFDDVTSEVTLPRWRAL